jgi:hypothetical protein
MVTSVPRLCRTRPGNPPPPNNAARAARVVWPLRHDGTHSRGASRHMYSPAHSPVFTGRAAAEQAERAAAAAERETAEQEQQRTSWHSTGIATTPAHGPRRCTHPQASLLQLLTTEQLHGDDDVQNSHKTAGEGLGGEVQKSLDCTGLIHGNSRRYETFRPTAGFAVVGLGS